MHLLPHGISHGGRYLVRTAAAEHHALHPEIPQNGALGCQSHHEMLDNGNKGRREEMLQMFRQYLQDHYPDWSEEALTYSKWK